MSKAVLAGPPNNGTPWAKFEDWAIVGLGAAINGLAAVIRPPATIPALVGTLASLVAGNTAKIHAAAPETARAEQALLERLVNRLASQPTRATIANLVFFGQPNDTSISVESMIGLPAGRIPAASLQEIACDHVSYFCTEVGLRTLAREL